MSNEPKEPLLLDHNYDGIQELDNNLPRWWVWLFYITIIFAAVYLVYYHVAKVGDLQAAEYDKEMKAGNAIKTAAMGNFESSIPSLQPSKDAVVIENGREYMNRETLVTVTKVLQTAAGRMIFGRPEDH